MVYGGPMLAVIIWWFVDAHKWFKGPKVNISHLMLGREGNVVEGAPVGGDKGADTEGEGEGSLGKDREEGKAL